MISFARGIPAPELFPADELAEAARLAFRRHSATALNYGPPAGFSLLQEWLGDQYRAPADRVVITPGSYMLLTLLARVLVTPPRPVLVEVPSYDRVNSARLFFSFPSVSVGADRLAAAARGRLASPGAA
jgi:2-aminoadipate transaminase